VKDLREIDTKSKSVNAAIPFEVVEAIDKGRNPEQCTYQMLYVMSAARNEDGEYSERGKNEY